MPLTPHSGSLGIKKAAHLLRRTCTGASIADIESFASMTAAEAVAELIRDDLPNPALPIDLNTGEEWITDGPDANTEDNDLTRWLNAWMMGQMFAPGIPDEQKLSFAFRERLVFFLHTHFTTKRSKASDTRALYYQNALFRHFAFDQNDIEVENPDTEDGLPLITYYVNFKELTKKISVENAMLVFLDGRLNVSGNPNENYARELLELYAIGRGLEGTTEEGDFEGDYIHYTEEDVQAGALVLTGFERDETFQNIDEETGIPRGIIRGNGLIASAHDNSDKTFSSRLGGATISPDEELLEGNSPTEESVLDEISQLVDLIYEQDETALHICRKIYRFFCYHEIDESVQSGMVQDLADVFVANEFKLIPVLEALFTSQEFYDGVSGVTDDFFGSIIKSPLDLTVGFIKNFNITVPDYELDTENFYDFVAGLLGDMNGQGLDYYEPFEVAGYSAYHQFPIYNRSWITTNYLTNRYNFISDRVTTGDLVNTGEINPYDFVKANIADSVARDARALVVALAEYLLPLNENLSFDGDDTSELTQERMNFFLDTFLDTMDIDPETAWTSNWDSADDVEKADNQLANLLNAMLQTPEYQLM